MSSGAEKFISSLKISKIKELRSKPSTARPSGNRRDLNWLKLFNRSSKTKAYTKISKFRPYCVQPLSPKFDIHPRYTVNAIGLYNALSHVKPLEAIPEKQSFTLQNFSEFSRTLEKSESLSRFSLSRNESLKCMTSRPNTARMRPTTATSKTSRPTTATTRPIYSARTIKSARKQSESQEILPERGLEFVREVKKIWEFMDKGQDIEILEDDDFDDEDYKIKKNVVLRLPDLHEENVDNCDKQFTPTALTMLLDEKIMNKGKTGENHWDDERLNIGILAEQKILTERTPVVRKSLVVKSMSYKNVLSTSRK
ncbi:hypothetical protein SteCoe_15827 [Stentor coeruleus]|uniref:Uncharacterized protein n=1 Tax=Stentor coeruleus TaxID=5963 RepID=A0A1R2C2Q0_9CILI|nr:hypothetical protein SteCoe_15827 [Stentor coeruleus]